jgi:hypothetical protein
MLVVDLEAFRGLFSQIAAKMATVGFPTIRLRIVSPLVPFQTLRRAVVTTSVS